MTTQKKSDYKDLVDLVKKQGKVCVAFIHVPLYGPLRSLNFFIEESNPDHVAEYLGNQSKTIDIVTEIWQATGLATVPMIIDEEIYKTAETPPKTFHTFKMAEKHIKALLKKNPSLRDDPWFYRLGKI